MNRSRAATPTLTVPIATGERRLTPEFYEAMGVIFLFSLGNASDAFLLLRFADVGIAAFWIPLLWSAIHVVKATRPSMAGGGRIGSDAATSSGWVAGVRGRLRARSRRRIGDGPRGGVSRRTACYFGLTEGAEKAWVADLAPADSRGNAFGIYNAMIGIGALIASLLFGFIWTHGPPRPRSSPAPASRWPRPRCYTRCFLRGCERLAARIRVSSCTTDSGHQRRRRASQGSASWRRAVARLARSRSSRRIIEASAIGHALTLRRPLRVEQLEPRALRSRRHADRLRQHRGHAYPAGLPDSSCPASTRATTSVTT